MKGLYILKDGDCVPYTFKDRVILVGVPGAFTPTCTNSHLPGFADNLEDLKSGNSITIDKIVKYLPDGKYKSKSGSRRFI